MSCSIYIHRPVNPVREVKYVPDEEFGAICYDDEIDKVVRLAILIALCEREV